MLLCALGAETATVRAAETREAPEAQVARSARQFLLAEAKRNGLANVTVEVTVANSRRELPPCREPLTVSPADTRYLTRMRFAARCASDGWQREFVVRADFSADVVVAATAIPANRAISAADVMVERRAIAATPDALSDPAAVAGHSSQRPLRAGQIVQKNWLAEPILFKRGAPVRIIARSGPINISTDGEALEAGRLNEVVQVRNVATGKVIRARVIDSAAVEPVDIPTPSYSTD